jgi:glycosyltransferase involved in cell wall biosynthesis
MQSSAIDFLLSEEVGPIFWAPERLSRSSAWRGHVPFAFWITTVCKPRILVELGTYHGVSYTAFCEAVARTRLETRCYAVDSWAGDAQGGFDADDVYNDLKDFHDKRYASFSELLRKSFDDACGCFADGTIDLLHIDRSRTYEAVRHDFETWRPKLSERAVVLFHNTDVRRDDFGVWRFFGELKEYLPGFEFLHCSGLGVCAVGAEAPIAIKELCGLTESADIAAVRDRFAHIGARWMAVADENSEITGRLRRLEQSLAQKDAKIAQLSDVVAYVSGRYAESHRIKSKSGFLGLWKAPKKSSLPPSVAPEVFEAVRNSVFFDAKFYLDANPDVRAAGMDPALHYLQHGGEEGRKPGPCFSTNEYLAENSDVAAAGMNALAHYELHGRREGRRLAPVSSNRGGIRLRRDNCAVNADGGDAHEKTGASDTQSDKRGQLTFLFITHTWGGGVERHVIDMTRLLGREGVRVFHGRPTDRESLVVSRQFIDQDEIEFRWRDGPDELAATLDRLGVDHIHVHSLVGCPDSSSDIIILACAKANIAFDFTTHDYLPVCPRINMVDPSTGIYCGTPSLACCELCINSNSSPFGKPAVEEWRARYRRFLNAARHVFVPNRDVAERLGNYFPGLEFSLRPHPEPNRQLKRIVLIGNVQLHKGSHILAETAREAFRNVLPLKFIVLGVTDCESELRSIGNVEIMGPYSDADAEADLRLLQADLAWFPSVCPETYCYALTIAMGLGLKCVSFDVGALATRIRDYGNGATLPLAISSEPLRIARELLQLSLPSLPHYTPIAYPELLSSYYQFAKEPAR